MPCEGCQVQFTVFKRKRSCGDCKRYYCHNCLVNTRKLSLCERCVLFSRRPLQRSDLLKLRTKDLIFYLQSKHISTAGCVEKEDLIDLVIQCVERMDGNQSSSSGSSSKSSSKNTTPQHNAAPPPPPLSSQGSRGGSGTGRRSFDNANSFDNIKQTCQNFFSSLSDNISDSIANLESRACSKTRPDRATEGNDNANKRNVTEQPRVATREIPTYASRQQQHSTSGTNSSQTTPSVRSPTTPSATVDQTTAESPVHTNVTTLGLTVTEPEVQITTEETANVDNNGGDCECSDEELINSFSTRTRSPKSTNDLNLPLSNDEADQATCAPSTSGSTSKPSSQHSKMEIYINDEEESSHSSFEELGAIGGISDDSKTTTDTTSNATDQWQMLDIKQDNQTQQHPPPPVEASESGTNTSGTATTAAHPDSQVEQPSPTLVSSGRVKKVSRRRSESYLNRRRPQYSLEDEDDETTAAHLSNNRNPSHARIEEETQTASATTTTARQCCMRCGKNKVNIRQQVERMRQHLESSQMSEADIKQELSEFLAFLEQRTKSVDYSDSDAGASTPSVGRVEAVMPERHFNMANSSYAFFGEMEASLNAYEKGSRFINLDDYDSMKQLESLSVKQLKEVLMLHRVDYKGCCEKQELLDRVERLWKNLKSTPAVEKLPTDELCKICMDAPIECVILECGHMATCTNCGKVLSECPICRQYIVRVVRFFRA